MTCIQQHLQHGTAFGPVFVQHVILSTLSVLIMLWQQDGDGQQCGFWRAFGPFMIHLEDMAITECPACHECWADQDATVPAANPVCRHIGEPPSNAGDNVIGEHQCILTSSGMTRSGELVGHASMCSLIGCAEPCVANSRGQVNQWLLGILVCPPDHDHFVNAIPGDDRQLRVRVTKPGTCLYRRQRVGRNLQAHAALHENSNTNRLKYCVIDPPKVRQSTWVEVPAPQRLCTSPQSGSVLAPKVKFAGTNRLMSLIMIGTGAIFPFGTNWLQ